MEENEKDNIETRLKVMQEKRDKDDDTFWSKVWWGEAAKTQKRRTDHLDNCYINLSKGKGKFSVLEFIVLDGRQTVYGVQRYYLRDQWKKEDEKQPEKSYWYADAGSNWMQGVFDRKDFIDRLDINGDLYKNADNDKKNFEVDLVGVIRPFAKEEKDLVAEVVLPFVRQIDEICSEEGRNADDLKIVLDSSGRVTGLDRTLKLNLFKTLMLLSVNCN